MISAGWVITVNTTTTPPTVEAHEVDAPGLLAVIAQLRHPDPVRPRKVRIIANEMNVRSAPEIKASNISWVTSAGVEYQYLDTALGEYAGQRITWYKIQGHDANRVGWVAGIIDGTKKAELI